MIDPGFVVVLDIELHGRLGDLHRPERIDHHGQFFGRFLSDASFDGSRMRAVRDACRMKGQLALVDIVPAHEITIHIVEDLVGVDIAVVIGRRDGFGMVVIQARDEGADHELVGFELLLRFTPNKIRVLTDSVISAQNLRMSPRSRL